MCQIPTHMDADNAASGPYLDHHAMRARDNRLVDLYVNHNMRSADAAKAVGISHTRAKDILKAHGVSRPVGRPKKCSAKDAR